MYIQRTARWGWTQVPCEYDLNDPRSRTTKPAFSERNMIRAGASMALTYDRCTDYAYCMTPKYGTYDRPWPAPCCKRRMRGQRRL